MEKGFPGGKAFLLESPAGMGKTVGLMAVAYWLRQRTDRPIMWLEPDGDLRGFFLRMAIGDFQNGAFVFIDDITPFIEAFEDISSNKFANISFICASRETRWRKYKRRFPVSIPVVVETLRKLNRSDAEELHAKISRYGTTVHFASTGPENQISEVLERSQKDMLVLIRELGQGKKFDAIVKSEILDLDPNQRFAYVMICLTDRNQVPLPIDLFGHALRYEFPEADMHGILDAMGRMLVSSGKRRTLRTRHSIIAQHVIEPRNAIITKREFRNTVCALLAAFSNYQIPIIVHHSNTGHARVFKTIINRRFLSEVLGPDTALGVYQEFEKTFEIDGFFWQQYGLCQSQAGNYEGAVETLRHAYAIHRHFLIKHSLGAASLQACAKLGREGLQENDFGVLRSDGREMLSDLHEEAGYRDDIAIATLVEIDMAISRKFDGSEEFRGLGEEYHRKLAFYIRDYPGMSEARRVYDKLNDLLLRASTIDDPNYDAVLENVGDDF